MRRRCWRNSLVASRKRWRITRNGCPRLRPCNNRYQSLMTAWRGLLTANIAPAAVLLTLADSKFNIFCAPRSQPVQERLSIAVLQVNASIVVEGAGRCRAGTLWRGAFSQRGSHRLVEEKFPTDESLRDLPVCTLQLLVVSDDWTVQDQTTCTFL